MVLWNNKVEPWHKESSCLRKGSAFQRRDKQDERPGPGQNRVTTELAEPLRKFKHPLKHTPSPLRNEQWMNYKLVINRAAFQKTAQVTTWKSICFRVLSRPLCHFRTGCSFHPFALTTLLFSRLPLEVCCGPLSFVQKKLQTVTSSRAKAQWAGLTFP